MLVLYEPINSTGVSIEMAHGLWDLWVRVNRSSN